MNETIVGELNSIKRKSQTQENTIAWLIQELLKSKKEIEELKRSVKTVQMSAEETQRKHVLDLVQGQQQHQRSLHMQLQHQLQAQQPSMLTPSQYTPPVKTEIPTLEQLRVHQHLQQTSLVQQQTQQTLQQSSFDINLYMASLQANGEVGSPDSSANSSDDSLAVLDNVYDGPDWMQLTQAQQQ